VTPRPYLPNTRSARFATIAHVSPDELAPSRAPQALHEVPEANVEQAPVGAAARPVRARLGHAVATWATGSRRPSWPLELLLVIGFYAGYDSIRGLIRSDAATAVVHGATVLHAERLFGLQMERPVNHFLSHLAPLAVPACFFYASLHFLITPGVLGWTWLRHPDRYRPVRTVIALVSAGALIGFALYPTAPPRLLPGAGFTDTMTAYRHWGWWGASDSAPTALAGLANQFAAMPSLHMAWAVWCGVTVYRLARRRLVRASALAYPVLTALVVIGTANHYLFDVLAGVALWWVADRAVARVARVAQS
jgi:hypothetical protein